MKHGWSVQCQSVRVSIVVVQLNHVSPPLVTYCLKLGPNNTKINYVKSLFTLGGKVNKNSMWVKEKKLGELICIRKCCPIVIFPWCSFKFSIEKSVYFSCPFVDII